MFRKFNLSEEEFKLLRFVLNLGEAENEFNQHDISCKGCVVSSTYYNNLYKKGLFTKPNRGKYKLNIELIERLAEEDAKRKERDTKRMAHICRICFVPMIVLGFVGMFVEPAFGFVCMCIGAIEFVYSKSCFKKLKENRKV